MANSSSPSSSPAPHAVQFDPQTLVMLIQGMLAALPSLISAYNTAKEKGNFTPEQRDALDAKIAGFAEKANWQE